MLNLRRLGCGQVVYGFSARIVRIRSGRRKGVHVREIAGEIVSPRQTKLRSSVRRAEIDHFPGDHQVLWRRRYRPGYLESSGIGVPLAFCRKRNFRGKRMRTVKRRRTEFLHLLLSGNLLLDIGLLR